MPDKARYRVTGPNAFQGHAPGETFTDDLDPGLEVRAISRGSIVRVAKKDPVKKLKNPPPDLSADHPERDGTITLAPDFSSERTKD